MRYEEALEITKKIIANIQKMSGRKVDEINEETIPIGDIEDFDSLIGVEFTSEVADFVDIGKCINFCVAEDEPRALSVREIAERIQKLENN